MLARALFVLGIIFISLTPRNAHAYTWMLKHGYGGCTTCHADPSGGELLTPYGRAQSDLLLRMRYSKDKVSAQGAQKDSSSSSGSFDSFDSFDSDDSSSKSSDAKSDDAKGDAAKSDAKSDDAKDAKSEGKSDAKPAEAAPADAAPSSDDGGLAPSSGFLWGLVTPPDWLLLGGSYRHLTLFEFGSTRFATFPMQADLYGQLDLGGVKLGGSIGAIRVPEGSPYARAAQITQNQGNQWNLISRTHYIGYEFGDGAYFIRAGRLNLPFGVRIPEHTMWVRSATRTDRESSQEHGVAFAFNGSVLRGEVLAIAGNYQINPDKFRERGYSAYIEYLAGTRTALGLSSEVTRAERDRVLVEPGVMLRQSHGAFARTALTDNIVLLAEADFLNRSFASPGYVGFAQLDLEAIQGLHFMATGETLDNGYDSRQSTNHTPGNGQPMFGGWGTIDWFFLPHVEFRFDAVARQQSNFTLLGQLHAFL